MRDRKLVESPEVWISTLFILACAYYDDGHPTGGWLHVWLDDGNWDRGSIQHCLDSASREGDHAAVLVAQLGLLLTDAEIAYYREWDRHGHPTRPDWWSLSLPDVLKELRAR